MHKLLCAFWCCRCCININFDHYYKDIKLSTMSSQLFSCQVYHQLYLIAMINAYKCRCFVHRYKTIFRYLYLNCIHVKKLFIIKPPIFMTGPINHILLRTFNLCFIKIEKYIGTTPTSERSNRVILDTCPLIISPPVFNYPSLSEIKKPVTSQIDQFYIFIPHKPRYNLLICRLCGY